MCNCQPEPVKSYNYNPHFRVVVHVDQDAQEPDWDGMWPMFEQAGATLVPLNKEAREIHCYEMDRAFSELSTEVFDRWLHVFMGARNVVSISTRDANYITFATDKLARYYQLHEDTDLQADVEALAGVWKAYFDGDVFGIELQQTTVPDEVYYDDHDPDDDVNWETVESVWGYYGWDEIEDSELKIRAREMGAHDPS